MQPQGVSWHGITSGHFSRACICASWSQALYNTDGIEDPEMDEEAAMRLDDDSVPWTQEELRENFPPVIQLDDARSSVHRIAKAFYDDPSSAMTTVGVAGEVLLNPLQI